MDHQDKLTNLEQWRDLALAHPWPVGLALLSVLWLLILMPWPHTPDSQIDLVSEHIAEGSADELVLDASNHDELPADGVITASAFASVGHDCCGPAVLVANEIEFAPDSRIWAPSGELVGHRAAHPNGVIDVSGGRGRDDRAPGGAGQDGDNGGVGLRRGRAVHRRDDRRQRRCRRRGPTRLRRRRGTQRLLWSTRIRTRRARHERRRRRRCRSTAARPA